MLNPIRRRTLGIVCGGGLAIGMLAATPAPAAASTITEFTIPTASSQPAGIAVGPDAALWFTEFGGNKIGRITAAGSISEFLIPAAGSLIPDGITPGPDGALWFTEINSIGRVTTTGSFSEFPVPSGSFAPGGPSSITVGPDGALWFTDPIGNNIWSVTTGGSFSKFPVPTANSQPEEMTLGPDGALWFTEFGGNKIGRITTAGSISEFPVPTAGSGPNGIIAGPDGALWFTEIQGPGDQIGRVTTTGSFSEFRVNSPDQITAGPDGALWFTEATNNIGRITTSGSFSEFPIPTAASSPGGITLGPDGALWFTEIGGNKIGRVSPVAVSSLPTFIGPICVSGLGVSLNGGVDWGQLPVGSITLDWGDSSQMASPAVFPAAHTYAAAGTYTITAAASSSGVSGTASQVVIVGSGQQTCAYSLSPQPIAPTGSLSPGQSMNLTVTVMDSSGNPLSGSPVWLSFAQAPGGGTASACCFFVGQTVPTPLGPTPQVLVTGVGQPAGTIAITYTTPNPLPAGGVDSLVVQNAPNNPTVTLTDTYTFTIPTITSLTATPNPVEVGHSVTYTATVSPTPTGGGVAFTDNGSPIAGCSSVPLSGASASCSVTYSSSGSQNVVAAYGGFATSLGSTSAVLSEIVTATPCSTLAGCNLNHLSLVSANLAGADLSNGNFNGANLSGANLAGSDLSGANFNQVDLTGADLAGAVTTGANLNRVTWSNTICPDGTNSDTDDETCVGHLTPLNFALELAMPVCVAGQPGLTTPSGITVCRVDPLRPPAGGWQASTNEWILFRVGWTDTLAGCQAFAANTSVSWTLDGIPMRGFQIPCSPIDGPGVYRTDWLLLSPPLGAGVHDFTVTEIAQLLLPGCVFGPAGGPTCTLNRSITVV